jgi:hypothetical protein
MKIIIISILVFYSCVQQKILERNIILDEEIQFSNPVSKQIIVTSVDSIENIEGKSKDFIVKLDVKEFESALVESIKNSKLFLEYKEGKNQIKARIVSVELNETVIVVDSISNIEVEYELIKLNEKKSFTIRSKGVTKYNEEKYIYSRIRNSIEKAMRNNIQTFLLRLSQEKY